MAKLGDVLLQPETGWSRFDDINTNIFYTGDWLVSTNSPATYNNSVHMKAYPKTTPYRIKFTFTGTGLRLMAQKTSVTEFKGLKTNVVIDGVDSGTFEMYDSSVSTVYQCIMFEELNLEPGPHTVIISTDALYFDAVDVQGGSIFTPKVDQVLTEPESGWTRIDDTNENITYIGQTWTPRTSLTGYYKDTYTNRSSNATDEGTVQFYFKGTGIRIISPRYQSQRPDMNVQIDGVPYGSYKIWDSKVNNLKGQIVAHEVLGLEDRVHEIKLTGTTHMVVDAFDILGGTIVARAKVGDVLTQPEPGWERINNSDPLIKYNKFVPITGVPSTQQCYLNDYHYTSGDGTVTLQFTGTGFNVLGITNIAYSSNISIEIDGVKETFSEKYEVGPYLRGSTLVYQKLNLENKSHTVKIYNSDVSKPLGFDAFDILGGNIEKPPAKVGDPLLQPELGWKRIDDTDSNLQYEGPWKTDLQSIYYNGTVHYGIDEGLKCSFKFKGTTFRFIGIRKSYYRNKAIIKIDGTEYDLAQVYPQPPVGSEQRFQTLVFEKLDLQNTVHSVELYGNDIMIDAFDIDADGSIEKLPAKVGDQLLQPESGWKRIDDTDASFKYVGNSWKSGITAGDEWFNSTFHYIDGGSGEVAFRFSGTKLRIIGCLQEPQYRSNDIKIIIDGNQEMYSEQSDKIRYQTLVYEKLGLAEGVHDVVIKSGTTSQFPLTLDAIDIDEKGSISKPTVKVGDQLRQPEPGWKRIDDTDSNIQYGGVWATESKSTHYNSTLHYKHDSSNPTDTNPSTIKFDFEGTKLRIIGLVATSSYDTNATIIIDGKSEVINFRGDTLKTQTLVYEKLNLPSGVHSVEIQGIYLNLDAIDIDSEGSIKKPNVKVGDILLQPELGWTRVDDANPLISYKGESWNLGTGDRASNYYNKTNNFRTVESPGSLQFFFKGTGIRIVSTLYNNVSAWTDVSVEIDGVAVGKYAQADGNLSAATYVALLFEKTGLNDGVHKIKLSGTKMNMDAFDILGGDIVKPPIQVGDELKQPEDGWKRIDDTDSNIKYLGNWQIASNGDSYYNSTMHFKNSVQGPEVVSAEFTFTGTKLRVISSIQAAYDKPVTVTIDGVQESYSLYKTTTQFQTLVYEKLNLPSGTHKVKIEGVTVMVDALDIDSDGYMEKTPVKVGDELKQPETGWKRIDDTDANIKYLGNWKTTKESNNYNSTIHYNITSGVQVSYQFEFSGSKLRIIGFGDTGYDKSASITIDGITEDIVYYQSKSGSQIIVYEKLNLKPGTHTVKVEGSIISLDAIDIEDTGSMVKPTIKVGDELKQPESGWKRIDDTDPSFKYRGKWENGAHTSHYNNSWHYVPATESNGFIEFNFYGTQLRIISLLDVDVANDMSITIDGVSEQYSGESSVRIYQGLAYEKLGLTKELHTVRIQCGTKSVFYRLFLDAIDIDSDGYIEKPPVKVGDQLSQPEAGWKRLDNTEPNFKYRGTWYQGVSAQWYNSTYHYVKDNDSLGAVEFDFYGTQLRIISCFDVSAYRSDDVSITIDGVTEKYSEIASANIGQVLAYEKLGLTKGKHRVRIQCGTKGTYRLNFDAIDIDLDGYIEWPPYKIDDIVTSPEPGWKRFDDNTSEILYDANWDNNVAYPGAYGGKSTRAHKGKNSSFRFKFKGTKFRLIVGSSTTEFYSDKISVRIDDLPLEFFDANAPADTNQVLKYEKLGLEDKEHEVKVKVETSRPGALSYDYRFDALDIDDTGSLIKINTIGNVLTEPEKGWKRIDDTDPLIRYIGNWKLATGNDKHYNKTTHYNLDKKLDTSFEFEFVGTKLRLLAYGDSGYDATSKVLINGKEETMVYNSPSGNQVIRYEKIGLDRGKHTVKVIGKAMSLDSIDIDADGYLLARLGDQLVEPEPGWVRFDDTHKNIEYNGFWKTTEADVSCYNNTHHWKSKEDNNDSTISARFVFKGTKFRLISMTSPSYPEDIELKIDGQKEILKLSGEGMQYQTFAYEKKKLENMIHVIELSGKYISIDAIDLEEGATLLKLPDEKLKPYQIRNGLIFKDDFDTFDSRWIASPVGSYSLIDRKGYFRMLHNVSRDTLLLADLPNEKEFAFEVSADYTPTHEDDKGGIIVWKNGEENIEFLETEDGTRETTELKWMACKDNEDWTFFSDYGEGFNFCDSDRMNCSKFGVVLKKGSNSKFINLDIDSIIATRGRKLTIANIAPDISVEMEDKFGRIIFNGNTGYNTGIQITLPSLEFAGKVILKNVEGKELGVIKTTFYGGDVYGFGSNLEIKFSGEELSILAQTRLPDMISGKSEIMLELVNPSVARANNVNLSIAQYEDKFGWSWADLALDSNGKPGQYQDSINIPYVNPENTIKFWLKVTKGTDYVGLAPLQFQIHLEHE